MNIVVNLDKPFGISSFEAVSAVKKIFKVRKAGHAGTLDPAATGVLLVCLNEATKITNFLSDLNKEYVMTAKLGESTDSYDSEGKVTKRVEGFYFSDDEIRNVIERFIGETEQIPPMYSALKVSGKPLYELARKGIEVERKPRKVTIHSIEILGFESPFLTLKVSCSKGTYIRSLCNDIGEALGVGAYITELRRTKIGNFTLEGSARIDELPHKSGALYSLDSALRHLQGIILEGDDLKRAQNGNPVKLDGGHGYLPGFVRLKEAEDKLFGIGKLAGNSIKIERLFKI